MGTSEILLIIVVVGIIVSKLWVLYHDYEPKITTVLIGDGHQKVYLEYQEYYSYYDIRGNQVWGKRTKKKYLLTT